MNHLTAKVGLSLHVFDLKVVNLQREGFETNLGRPDDQLRTQRPLVCRARCKSGWGYFLFEKPKNIIGYYNEEKKFDQILLLPGMS